MTEQELEAKRYTFHLNEGGELNAIVHGVNITDSMVVFYGDLGDGELSVTGGISIDAVKWFTVGDPDDDPETDPGPTVWDSDWGLHPEVARRGVEPVPDPFRGQFKEAANGG